MGLRAHLVVLIYGLNDCCALYLFFDWNLLRNVGLAAKLIFGVKQTALEAKTQSGYTTFRPLHLFVIRISETL